MAELDLRAPLFSWWLFAPLVGAVICILGLVYLRPRSVAVAAALSVLIGCALAALLPLSWNNVYAATVAWDEPQPNGENHRWGVRIESRQGGIRASVEATEWANRTWGAPKVYLYADTAGSLGPGNYPIYGPRFSVTHNDFLEKKLGFQICWANFPENPGQTTDVGMYSITVPHWFVLLLCVPFPLVWVRGVFNRRKLRRLAVEGPGCARCNFDLRAHAPGARCPECGLVVPPRPASAAAPPGSSASPRDAAAPG